MIGFDADGVHLRFSAEVRWREMGYEIFQALERHSGTNFGYAITRWVDVIMPEKVDDMPRYAKFNLPLPLPI